MCCLTKENICFFLSDRLFCCHFNGLIILLKSFSSSAGTSYALSTQTSLSGITHSCLWHDQRKEAGSNLSKGISANLLPATFLCIGHTSKVWISARQFFRFFFFDVFPSLGGGSKSRIVCRRRSRSYSGGDKSLTRLSPTPSTYRTKP